jgi:prepilin-type N-terminal cleavage/methylation domain-containing protein
MTAGNLSIHRPTKQRGFTLLEVMVSLMVLAVVLVTVFRLHAGTIRLVEARKTAVMMPLLAQYQLSDIQAAGADPGILSGRFPGETAGFEWLCIIEPAGFNDPVPLSGARSEQLKKISLEITDPAGNRSFAITTWRYVVEDDRE